MKDIFNFTLVKADYRASEESEDSRNSILGSIIGRTVDRSAADERIQELIQALEEDMETAIQHPAFTEDTISLKIFGTTYTDRKELQKHCWKQEEHARIQGAYILDRIEGLNWKDTLTLLPQRFRSV